MRVILNFYCSFLFSQKAALVEKEYYILLDFLKVVAACQKPKQDTLEILIKDFPVAIEAINRAKESMRRDREWYTHLTFLCEGSPVIAWVVNVRLLILIPQREDSYQTLS